MGAARLDRWSHTGAMVPALVRPAAYTAACDRSYGVASDLQVLFWISGRPQKYRVPVYKRRDHHGVRGDRFFSKK